MRLDDDAKAKVKNHLNKIWPEPECTICHKKDKLHISDTKFILKEYIPKEYENKDYVREIPVIAVICHNCGNVILFDTYAIGIEIGDY